MAKYIDADKLKAKIERLKEENGKIKCSANERYCSGYDDAFYDLVPFLSTLESEKPMQEGLEEEIEAYFDSNFGTPWDGCHPIGVFELDSMARHFAQWGAEHLADARKMIKPEKKEGRTDCSPQGEVPNDSLATQSYEKTPNDLEEAAKKFAVFYDQGTCDGIAQDCFIAGAKWQKEQDDKELSEKIAAAYQLGIKDKEQKSVEGLDEVAKAYALDTAEDSEQYSARYLGYKDGAKWQKQHDAELIEIAYNDGITIGMTKQKEQDDKELSDLLTIAHLQGADQMKEQMLKEAVEWTVTTNLANRPVIYLDQLRGYKYGEKVRVIVIPNTDEK